MGYGFACVDGMGIFFEEGGRGIMDRGRERDVWAGRLMRGDIMQAPEFQDIIEGRDEALLYHSKNKIKIDSR